MGLVPYMGCLFTAAITRAQLNFFSLICECKNQSPLGLILQFLTVSFLLCIYNLYVLNNSKWPYVLLSCSLSHRVSAPTPMCLSAILFGVTVNVKI